MNIEHGIVGIIFVVLFPVALVFLYAAFRDYTR